MKARTLTVVLVVVLAAATGAATAQDASVSDAIDSDTKLAEAASTLTDGGFPTEEVLGYAEGPSFIVKFGDGSAGSVKSWANSSETRRVVEIDNDSDRAVVAAPLDEVGVTLVSRLTGAPLSEEGYVEWIEPNARVSVQVEPSLMDEDDFEAPGRLTQFTSDGSISGDAQTGVAYDGDANETSIGNASEVVAADGVSADGTGVHICVADNGYNHADSVIDSGRIHAAKDIIDNETGLENVSGGAHGTWVTSSIAANYSGTEYDGIAPNATVSIAKVLSDDGGSTIDVAKGVGWCEEQGADVISMSLGSPLWSQTLANEIQAALDGNVTVVNVAAGNSRQSRRAAIGSPADADGAITVAATNSRPPESAMSAYFSQVGPDDGVSDNSGGTTAGELPDVAAPGMDVTVKSDKDDDGAVENHTLSGTSMATPVFSGVSALTLDSDSSLINDTDATRSRLLDTASPMPNAGTTEVGNGMVNASRSVDDNPADESQESARNTQAESRDAFNRGAGGGGITEWF